jgi:hypothetical protein
VNSEAARQLACAGQVFAGLEVARQDGKLHLGDKLAIFGDLAVRGNQSLTYPRGTNNVSYTSPNLIPIGGPG